MNVRTLLLAALLSTPALALDAGPFAQGNMSLGLGLGATSNQDFIVGGGVGYYVYDGLKGELDVAYWFTDDGVWDVSPGVRYTAWFVPLIKPYAGVFYRHLFATDDVDLVGWRLGASLLNGGTIISGGVRYDKVVSDCPESCDAYNYEIGVGITF